jgi:hypothetical protein
LLLIHRFDLPYSWATSQEETGVLTARCGQILHLRLFKPKKVLPCTRSRKKRLLTDCSHSGARCPR